jgi:PIN domain nuclease of toxin-antitoxin system
VLDASALLALLRQEPGSQQVREALRDGTAMSAVNVSEVVAKLAETGMPDHLIHVTLDPLGIATVDFDADLAYRAGLLRPATRQGGHSLGDRACLALAERLSLPVLTTDRSWQGLKLGLTVRVIR